MSANKAVGFAAHCFGCCQIGRPHHQLSLSKDECALLMKKDEQRHDLRWRYSDCVDIYYLVAC